MDTTTIEKAFRQLAKTIDYPMPVEMLLVGGAAGMVTGVLQQSRTTTDCDVMVYSPEDAMGAVELAAEKVAQNLQLPKYWLNSEVQIRRDTLPDGWKLRRIRIHQSDHLRVFAVSRQDLIAMKILASRAQDIEDIQAMRVNGDDVAFVRRYLKGLEKKGTTQGQVDDALALLGELKVCES